MINIKNIKYRVVVITETGKRYNITKLVQDLGWEEPESELAARITLKLQNKKTRIGKMASVLKPGVLLLIYAVNGGRSREAARGYVVDWNQRKTSDANELSITAYDELYNLQKSQDNVFYEEGTRTEAAVRQLFDSWGIPMDRYRGPDVTHAKMVYKSKRISDILTEILEDAKTRGGASCIIRSSRGKVSILPRCSNSAIYCFTGKNTETLSYKKSTADMVTRVKIYGKQNDEGRTSVEAILDGDTSFGIRQKIQSKGEKESLEEVKKEAQEILDEKGKTEKDIRVETPDVPYVRKGDVVCMRAGYLKGYYEVLSVRHDAESRKMDLELKKTKSPQEARGSEGFQVGDEVQFKGGTHYVSSYPGAAGYPASAGKAKITAKNGLGKAHPWQLIHSDAGSNVYGWVDEGTFEGVKG